MARYLALAFLIILLLSSSSTRTQIVTKPVGVGETAPDFTLVDHQGRKVTLSDSRGKSPVVLVFYRGYW